MALVRNVALSLMFLAAPAMAQTPTAATKPEAKAPALKPIGEQIGAPKSEDKPAAPAKPAEKAADKPLAAQPTAAAKVDDWPAGAPRGDYEFTAWCYGVLKRHMELYDEVKPELQAISKRWNTEKEDEKSYGEQIAAGRTHLTAFARAIETAEKASARPINTQGAAAAEQGRRMWNELKTVEPTWQAYSWMNWALPDRCITTAAALEEKSLLLSPALKANTKAAAAKPTKTDSEPDSVAKLIEAANQKPASDKED